MKKFIVVLINLLLVSALIMNVAAEESGDATGNAYGPGNGGQTEISATISKDELLSQIDTENRENVEVQNYYVSLGPATVDASNSEAVITMDISLYVVYSFTDEYGGTNYAGDSITGTLPEVSLKIYLPENVKEQLPAEKEGYTRTWKVTAKHEDGTTDTWDAEVDVNTGLVSFTANKFSTFTLSYTDTKNEEPPVEDKTDDTTPSTPETPKTDTSETTTTNKTSSDNRYRVVNTAGK